jgi:hypothetical protein
MIIKEASNKQEETKNGVICEHKAHNGKYMSAQIIETTNTQRQTIC